MTPVQDIGPILLGKTTRLCAAIYKITDFFDVDEPLRIKVRERGTDLLTSVVSYSLASAKRPAELVKDIKDNINAITTFFSVLVISELVSIGNGQILKDELMSLMRLVEEYFQNRYGYIVNFDEFPDLEAGLVNREQLGEPKITSDRKAKIVEFIKSNGPSSIRDLVEVVRGCSEKTIQRELLALIESGLIVREGQRRWSKYLIAS